MVKNYKELSNKWRKFNVNGETYYGKFEGAKNTDLQTKKNGKYKRIDINSIDDNDLKEAIEGIEVADKLGI